MSVLIKQCFQLREQTFLFGCFLILAVINPCTGCGVTLLCWLILLVVGLMDFKTL